jgi:hypothetical protein
LASGYRLDGSAFAMVCEQIIGKMLSTDALTYQEKCIASDPSRAYLNLSSRAMEEDDSTQFRALNKTKSTAAAVLLGILEMPAQKK